mmetsp:Transcript_15619/g.39648  ORF Transcript_15619/g.39648 Transcript_15619/m.39648 type:complete len:214 (+) Transcript_15619:161-802(+)
MCKAGRKIRHNSMRLNPCRRQKICNPTRRRCARHKLSPSTSPRAGGVGASALFGHGESNAFSSGNLVAGLQDLLQASNVDQHLTLGFVHTLVVQISKDRDYLLIGDIQIQCLSNALLHLLRGDLGTTTCQLLHHLGLNPRPDSLGNQVDVAEGEFKRTRLHVLQSVLVSPAQIEWHGIDCARRTHEEILRGIPRARRRIDLATALSPFPLNLA